jgi:hypothetical protein
MVVFLREFWMTEFAWFVFCGVLLTDAERTPVRRVGGRIQTRVSGRARRFA